MSGAASQRDLILTLMTQDELEKKKKKVEACSPLLTLPETSINQTIHSEPGAALTLYFNTLM